MMEYADREKFIAELKPGDKFAVRSRRLSSYGRAWGYQVFTLKKVTPSRTKYTALCPDSTEWTFGRQGSCKVGSSWSAEYFYMEPVTAEVMESIRIDSIRVKADNRKWRLIEKLTEVRDGFGEKDEMFHLEFISSSSQLMALLDKHTKPDPEDS